MPKFQLNVDPPSDRDLMTKTKSEEAWIFLPSIVYGFVGHNERAG